MDSDPIQHQDTPPVGGPVGGPSPEKRAYCKPVLVEYGNVRELTRGTGTKAADFMNITRRPSGN